MPTPLFNPIFANAYRTLGLSADASQNEVDHALRRMRIVSATTAVTATPYDLPWLGPLSRERHQIEQAAALLADPAARVRQRMFWFYRADGLDVSSLSKLPLSFLESRDAKGTHDAALLLLLAGRLGDPGLFHPELWRQAIAATANVADSSECRDMARAVENNSEFEKRARSEEIESSHPLLLEMIFEFIAGQFESALETRQFKLCGRILTILDGGAPAGDEHVRILAATRRRLLDRIEEIVEQRCAELRVRIKNTLRTDEKRRFVGSVEITAAVQRLMKEYNREVSPLIAMIDRLPRLDPERFERMRAAAAMTMTHFARARLAAKKYLGANRSFKAAAYLARGSADLAAIVEERKNNAPVIRRDVGRVVLALVALIMIALLFRIVLSAPPAPTVSGPDIHSEVARELKKMTPTVPDLGHGRPDLLAGTSTQPSTRSSP